MPTVVERKIREWKVLIEDESVSVTIWDLKDDSLYCVDCSSRTCEHVHAVWEHLRVINIQMQRG